MRVWLCNRVREMSTLDVLFNRGRKRRLESLEGSTESQVSTDGSASSLIDADSECSQSDDAIAPRPPGKRKWQASWMKRYSWQEKKGIGPRTCLRPGYDLLSLKEYWNHLCESVLRAHCSRTLMSSVQPCTFVQQSKEGSD